MINYDDIIELELECTTVCNAQCPLCYRNYKSFQESPYAKPIIRSFNDVRNHLEKFQNLKFVMLVGSMSEPTLYVDFLRLVEYLKSRRIKLEICTNGDTRDDMFWGRLGGLLDSNDSVYFTICGCTQEMHEKYRRGTNLENIIRHARCLREVMPVDYAQCIRFKYNSAHLDSQEFKNFVSEFSNVYMTETFYPQMPDTYNTEFEICDFMPCNEKIRLYDKLKKFVETRYANATHYKSACMCKENHRFQMDVFGNIYPCYLFLESMNGSVWSGDYDDIEYVNHKCCRFCDCVAQKYASRYKLEYII